MKSVNPASKAYIRRLAFGVPISLSEYEPVADLAQRAMQRVAQTTRLRLMSRPVLTDRFAELNLTVAGLSDEVFCALTDIKNSHSATAKTPAHRYRQVAIRMPFGEIAVEQLSIVGIALNEMLAPLFGSAWHQTVVTHVETMFAINGISLDDWRLNRGANVLLSGVDGLEDSSDPVHTADELVDIHGGFATIFPELTFIRVDSFDRLSSRVSDLDSAKTCLDKIDLEPHSTNAIAMGLRWRPKAIWRLVATSIQQSGLFAPASEKSWAFGYMSRDERAALAAGWPAHH